MSVVKLKCKWCNEPIEVYEPEYNRWVKKGREHFFCNLSCTAKYRNSIRPDAVKPLTKICPHCGEKFGTFTGKKEKIFCSRSCASKGSVTKKRLEGNRKGGINSLHSIDTIANCMKKREAYKYTKLREFLETVSDNFEFEEIIGDYIYDLIIYDKKIIIEFDGADHKVKKQQDIDALKEQVAIKNGYSIYRVEVGRKEVIQSSLIEKII